MIPNEVDGSSMAAWIILVVGLFGFAGAVAGLSVWEGTHCILCRRRIPWKLAINLDSSCENEGDCRLEVSIQAFNRREKKKRDR